MGRNIKFFRTVEEKHRRDRIINEFVEAELQ
jgi:hypothetical protein